MITSENAVPAMEDVGVRFLDQAMDTSIVFLEYGCGGSTLFAATKKNIPYIISVDSDKNWSDRVRSLMPKTCISHIKHVDIGPVGEWGKPIDLSGTKNYFRYPSEPWKISRKESLIPDTILIDGRFRVACFLYSLLNARVGTRIIFDDYFNRPFYFEVEKFCSVNSQHGRLAEFIVTKNFNYSDLTLAFAKYSVDWR